MQIEHKKNTTYYLAFPMIDATSPQSFASGETVADTAYYKDGAGVWTTLPITDTVSEIGSTGMYEVDLSAAEMNHDQVIIKMTSTNSADTAFLFNLNTLALDDVSTSTDLATAQADLDTITGASGVVISAATANEIADATLNRDMSAVSDTNARTPLNALRFLRNKYSVAGSTLTVTKEDDSTSAWTSTLTSDAAADPVTGSDPA